MASRMALLLSFWPEWGPEQCMPKGASEIGVNSRLQLPSVAATCKLYASEVLNGFSLKMINWDEDPCKLQEYWRSHPPSRTGIPFEWASHEQLPVSFADFSRTMCIAQSTSPTLFAYILLFGSVYYKKISLWFYLKQARIYFGFLKSQIALQLFPQGFELSPEPYFE